MTKKYSRKKKPLKRKSKNTIKKKSAIQKGSSNLNDLPKEVLNHSVGDYLDVESKLHLLNTKTDFNFEITDLSEWFEYIQIKYKTLLKEMQNSIIPNPNEHMLKLQFRFQLSFDGKGIYDMYELKPYEMKFYVKFNNDMIQLFIQSGYDDFKEVSSFQSGGEVVSYLKNELLKKSDEFIDKTDKDLEKIIKSTTPNNIMELLDHKLTSARIKEFENSTPLNVLYDMLEETMPIFNMPLFGDKVTYHIESMNVRCYIEPANEDNIIIVDEEQ